MGHTVIEHYIEPIFSFYRVQTKLNFVILMDNASVVGWSWLAVKHPHSDSLAPSSEWDGEGENKKDERMGRLMGQNTRKSPVTNASETDSTLGNLTSFIAS